MKILTDEERQKAVVKCKKAVAVVIKKCKTNVPLANKLFVVAAILEEAPVLAGFVTDAGIQEWGRTKDPTVARKVLNIVEDMRKTGINPLTNRRMLRGVKLSQGTIRDLKRVVSGRSSMGSVGGGRHPMRITMSPARIDLLKLMQAAAIKAHPNRTAEINALVNALTPNQTTIA